MATKTKRKETTRKKTMEKQTKSGRPSRLYRSETDKVLGGVAGGLGEYFNVDPVILRLVMVVLAIVPNGMGVLLYIILWIVLPVKSKAENSTSDENLKENLNDVKGTVKNLAMKVKKNVGDRSTSYSRMWLGLILVSLGLISLFDNIGFLAGKLWPLLLVALGVALILKNEQEK